MCGIFGLVLKSNSGFKAKDLHAVVATLFRLSQNRGSEAAGIAVAGQKDLSMFRRAQSAAKMLKTPEFKAFTERSLSPSVCASGLALVGHSRLVTNGSQGMEENNQPVATDHCIGVHNGIIVNDTELWRAHPELKKKSLVDTEVFYRLIDHAYAANGGDMQAAVKNAYDEIVGEANIAFVHAAERALFIASNVGSLYAVALPEKGLFVFASERHFLRELLRAAPLRSSERNSALFQIKPDEALIVGVDDLSLHAFALSTQKTDAPSVAQKMAARPLLDLSPRRPELRRCTKCVLPHTFPYISFDSEGVCNYCREGVPERPDNRQTLEAKLAPFRSKDGSPDCIVALSGGRDSCYGLHYIKRELGMNPIAYTYDWAMVTDEARRNCSRICAELKVEHIIRSADILSKRRNIRLNVQAWLKRPELGMIPLFMAGDKQFFHYASQVSKQTGVPLVIFCGGNNLEVTRFKTGFCGVKDRSVNTMVGLDNWGKIKLLAYYAKNFLLNPSYLNRSLFDTLFAFYATYIRRGEFLYLYRYIDWNEKQIAETLAKHYGWESAGDSASTWRIGDGTAAFYNYIYHTVAGFSEHDTFRSNQVRMGLMTRDRALALVEQENKPRYEAMQEYAKLVGFSLDETLVVINNMKKIV